MIIKKKDNIKTAFRFSNLEQNKETSFIESVQMRFVSSFFFIFLKFCQLFLDFIVRLLLSLPNRLIALFISQGRPIGKNMFRIIHQDYYTINEEELFLLIKPANGARVSSSS